MKRLALALAVLALSACATTPPPLLPTLTLTLLSTNDFHGALESDDTDRDSGRPIGGAEYLAAVIERERAENPLATLMLDGGDIYQGTALSNLTDGRSSIDFMNLADYDAAAVGNHEFDFGIDVMVERIEQAEFPVLCANVRERATQQAPVWARPYHVEERQGLRVAIIGLVTEDTPRVTLPQNVAHLEFLDAAAVADSLIGVLVPERADLAILLCHIGGSVDRETGQARGHMVDLARRVQGEAAVVGGHTHQRVNEVLDDGTVLIEAGSSGRWVARADLVVDLVTRKVASATTEMITVFSDDIEPDAEVAAMVAGYREEVAPILDEVLGEAGMELSASRQECPMGNLLCDVQRDAVNADFAFQNPGGVRASIEPGTIRFSDVYRVMPFDNTIVTAPLTGAEVMQLLEEAVGDGGFLHVAGLRYTADYQKPRGERVVEVTLAGGDALDPRATYTVAYNNFMGQGGDSLPVITYRDDATDTGILIREAFADWIRAKASPIEVQVEGRVTSLGR